MSQANMDRLAEDLARVVRDAEGLLRATAGEAGEKVAELRARAQASLDAARERLAGLGEDAAERARTAAERTSAQVKANPWVAVGIGAAAGLLVGLLLGRRGGGAS